MVLEEREQTQADTIALYLAARAGYSTDAFTEVFDRTAETKGKTGGSGRIYSAPPSRTPSVCAEILKNRPAMPPSCVAVRNDQAADFNRWKNAVIEYSTAARGQQEALPGLLSKHEMSQRLLPEIQTISISCDGKYVLAQDDNSIFVLTRTPLKALFRIDAPEAEAAQFTPDSRSIVFEFASLEASPRVERWSIEDRKRAEVARNLRTRRMPVQRGFARRQDPGLFDE